MAFRTMKAFQYRTGRFQKLFSKVSKMAQQVKTLVTMPEDWCAIAGTHMMEAEKQFRNCSLTNGYTCTHE